MTSRAFICLAATVVGTMATSCASTKRTEHTPATASAKPPATGHGMAAGMAMKGATCPMQVPGTTVSTADVEGGVALSFTTTGDVADVRRRVSHMAEMHNQMHSEGTMTMGAHGGGPGPGHGMGEGGKMSGGMMMPASTASAEDIAGGARLVLRPDDPAQLGALREHAKMMQSARMGGGDCPMMAPSHGSSSPEMHHPTPK